MADACHRSATPNLEPNAPRTLTLTLTLALPLVLTLALALTLARVALSPSPTQGSLEEEEVASNASGEESLTPRTHTLNNPHPIPKP